MKKLLLIAILFISALGYSQIPPSYNVDGSKAPFFELDSLTTTERDALPVSTSGTRFIYHKDAVTGNNQLEWRNIVTNEWQAFGGGGSQDLQSVLDRNNTSSTGLVISNSAIETPLSVVKPGSGSVNLHYNRMRFYRSNGTTYEINIPSGSLSEVKTWAVEADPSGFDGNLVNTDNTLQEIAQKFDDYEGSATIDYEGLNEAGSLAENNLVVTLGGALSTLTMDTNYGDATFSDNLRIDGDELAFGSAFGHINFISGQGNIYGLQTEAYSPLWINDYEPALRSEVYSKIESLPDASMTDTEVASAYENNPDTNKFTDAEKVNLSANTAKVGITAQQAADIVTNNAKGSGTLNPPPNDGEKYVYQGNDWLSIGNSTTYNQATPPDVTGLSFLPNTASFVANKDMLLVKKLINETNYYFWVQLEN